MESSKENHDFLVKGLEKQYKESHEATTKLQEELKKKVSILKKTLKVKKVLKKDEL